MAQISTNVSTTLARIRISITDYLHNGMYCMYDIVSMLTCAQVSTSNYVTIYSGFSKTFQSVSISPIALKCSYTRSSLYKTYWILNHAIIYDPDEGDKML